MAMLQTAFDLLRPGETGLFIYTNGLNLKINGDGTGESGWWVLSPERQFERVFIFKRSDDNTSPHEVFSGHCVEMEGSDEGRYNLRLSDLRREGTTHSTWKVFASAGQNPIRFLSAEPGGREARVQEMMLTEVIGLFGQLRFEHDDREPPDNRRKSKFHEGWGDATTRHQVYTEETLVRLTWQNLGYRFGKRVGHSTVEQIEAAYDHLARLYEDVWSDGLFALPGEVPEGSDLVEGAVCRVSVNAYERSREARRRCIEHHGNKCCICAFSFGDRYGDVAEGFIHIHHLRPLSEVEGEYVVDPVEDLRPVCPNCHAVLHRRTPAYSIEEVRTFFRRAIRS